VVLVLFVNRKTDVEVAIAMFRSWVTSLLTYSPTIRYIYMYPT
jgi:hypothetical protein